MVVAVVGEAAAAAAATEYTPCFNEALEVLLTGNLGHSRTGPLHLLQPHSQVGGSPEWRVVAVVSDMGATKKKRWAKCSRTTYSVFVLTATRFYFNSGAPF